MLLFCTHAIFLRKDEPKTDILKLARHLQFKTKQQGIENWDNDDHAKIFSWNIEIKFQSNYDTIDYYSKWFKSQSYNLIFEKTF